MTTVVRLPVAAGTFYPHNAARLETDVSAMLAAAAHWNPDDGRPFALIVPHAGYRYSGPVAASAYAGLRSRSAATRRVALFGPAHFEPFDGAAVSGMNAWRTPLGDVDVDDELRRIAISAGTPVDEAPHVREHALEVQLPWLQVVLGPEMRIVPVAVGRSSPEVVAALIAPVGDAADLVVISTDLSHYLPIDQARRRDRCTADAVLARDAAAIGPDDACGLFALRGAVELARQRGLAVRMLDLRTSGDITGDPTRVVGYGAFAIAGG